MRSKLLAKPLARHLLASLPLVMALGLTGAVAAQPAPAGPDRHAPVTHEQAMAKAHEMFARLDLNHDGKVTAEEVGQARSQMRGAMRDRMFDMLDANHDGAISKAEWAAGADRMAARRSERREGHEGAPGSMAPHGEGQGHEGQGHGMRGHMGGHMGGRMGAGGPGAFLEHFDANGDGVVTEQEFMARFEARFKHHDRNGDGAIDSQDHQGRHAHEGHDGAAAPR